MHINSNAQEFKVPLEEAEGARSLFSFEENFSLVELLVSVFFLRGGPQSPRRTLKAPEFALQDSLPFRTLAACHPKPPWFSVQSCC